MPRPSTHIDLYALIDRLRGLDQERESVRVQIIEALKDAGELPPSVAAAFQRAARRRPPGKRGRPGQSRSGQNLVELLAGLLNGRTMGATQLAEAARAAGYISRSRYFRTIVNATLLNHPARFKRTGWGKYTAKR